MGDHDDGLPLRLPQRHELILKVHAGERIQQREGLVEEEKPRLEGEGAGDAHPLLHARGELARIAVALPRQAHRGQIGLGLRRGGARANLARESRTLSRTVSHGRSVADWNTTPRSVPGPLTSRPPMTTPPVVGWFNPITMDSTVDLPQPEWPTMQTNSPSTDVQGEVADDLGGARRRRVRLPEPGDLDESARISHGIHQAAPRRQARRNSTMPSRAF